MWIFLCLKEKEKWNPVKLMSYRKNIYFSKQKYRSLFNMRICDILFKLVLSPGLSL